MNILIIHKNGRAVLARNVEAAPRKGDAVDVFKIHPYPVVDMVLMYPTKETLSSLEQNFDVIVTAIVTVS